MNRRGFLARLLGSAAAPLLPAPAPIADFTTENMVVRCTYRFAVSDWRGAYATGAT